MFFILSKTVAFLLLPSNFLILVGLIGLALMATRWRRAGKRAALICLALLLAIAILPLPVVLTSPLENRFPRWDPARGAPDGIVILGGALSPDISLDRGMPDLGEGAGRIVAIARLARQYPAARIIYSGGNGSLFPGKPAEADALGPVLDDFGVPRSRVVLENRSRNTVENAIFSKAIAQPKPGDRWLLVTSAWHMPRAVGCFRRAGFPVEAYPVDWRTLTHPRYAISTWPAANLYATDVVVHEWMGLFAYWVTGRTGQLLPAP